MHEIEFKDRHHNGSNKPKHFGPVNGFKHHEAVPEIGQGFAAIDRVSRWAELFLSGITLVTVFGLGVLGMIKAYQVFVQDAPLFIGG